MVTIAPTMDNTLGAVLVGSLVAACLYGVTTLQTYTYFGRCRGDSVLLRSLIAFLWILDTVHAVFVSHALYTSAVTKYGDTPFPDRPGWSTIAQIVIMGVSDGLIRAIYCYRILILSNRNRVAFGINALMSVVLFCEMIFICISALPRHPGPSATFATLFYMNMSSGVVADGTISVTMTWLLVREKSSVNFRRTNHAIHTLMLYSVSTGALVTLCYLGCLISYAVAPNSFIFLAFITNISKLFLNSLLASLNSRQAIRAEMRGSRTFDDLLSIPGAQWQGSDGLQKDSGSHRSSAQVSAQV